MDRQVILLLTIVCCASASIDHKQITGLNKLLGLGDKAYATCNIVLFTELVQYEEASANCKKFNLGAGLGEEGRLATVDDEEKNHDLMALLEKAYPIVDQDDKSPWTSKKWVWSGLRKTKNNDVVGLKRGDYDPLDWEWADGSHPLDFQRWFNFDNRKKAQPDQYSLKYGKKSSSDKKCDEKPRCYQNQMRINHDGLWDDTFKQLEHPYACDYQGKYVLSKEQLKWVDAKEACEEAGLHLAKIRSNEEVEEILAAMVHFLGPVEELTEDNEWVDTNWLWVGGSDAGEEGTWVWTDGELVLPEKGSDWVFPWHEKKGNDNGSRKLRKKGGQDALSFSRWGEFDDSHIDNMETMRPFACQCPEDVGLHIH
ncbi:uncharacterized protein LOC134821842 [Bolinopsis microptera]|uniref:uncharacterized protein LOC134821842 n=1 Tax=Bolinopsis microptera TaxID=2820187 RepID=UPI003078D4FC